MDKVDVLKEGTITVTQRVNNLVAVQEDDRYKNLVQKIALGTVGVLGASVTFTLEVLGATGAFWGATDVFHLRNEANDYQFRCMAIGLGTLALIRYAAVHALSQHKLRTYSKDIDQVSALESIYKAFESPIPAIKSLIVSLYYKFRYDPVIPVLSTSQGELSEELLLKCKYENCDNTAGIDPIPLLRRRNVGENGSIEYSVVSKSAKKNKE